MNTYIRLIALALALGILASCGGGSSEEVTPPQTPPQAPVTDTRPDAFSFDAVENAELSSVIESNSIIVKGINAPASITIQGGEYAIDDADFTQNQATISQDQSVKVRITSSANYQTPVQADLTIGGITTSFIVTTLAAAQTPSVISVNFDHVHSVHGVSDFDREKFITIHASHTENDWYVVGDNEQEDLITDFVETYDVYFGRDTGAMAWQLGLLPEDPARDGFIDRQQASANGQSVKSQYTNGTSNRNQLQRKHEHRNTNMIVAAQQHPYYPDGKVTRAGWAFSTNDTQAEPFGSATGEYMADFIAKYFKQSSNDTIGQPKPTLVEVMNEPLYELVTVAQEPENLTKIFEFHNTVANQIRNVDVEGVQPNQGIKIGGYTAAFPNFEENNFARWIARDQHFIDVAGANMDFLSIHLYDFPIFGTREQYRSGANVEATLDMLEQYTHMKFGEPMPLVISEYGAQAHNLTNQPWTPQRDWYFVRAINSLNFAFMSRPHLIEKLIPFIVVKAEWGRLAETVPYGPRLMRQQFEASGESGDLWVYSDHIKYYDLWKNINGERVESQSTDIDLQHLSYIDKNRAFIIINNIGEQRKSFDLSALGLDQAVSNVLVREMFAINGITQLNDTPLTEIPTSLEIDSFGTTVLEITLANDDLPVETSEEHKYYADKYLQEINAGKANLFNIDGVEINESASAILRISLGRDFNSSLSGVLTINGILVEIPENYRGMEQSLNGRGRDSFYGTLEVNVPSHLIAQNNEISLSFPDQGGHIASITLQYIANSAFASQP
jgi:agarase